MGALNALRTGSTALGRNPILFAAAAIMTLVILLGQLPRFAFANSPLLAVVVSLVFSLLLIFLTPFFQGGLVGMADEAIDGRTSFGTFVTAGKRHYVSLFAAYLLLLAVSFVLGIAFAIVAGIGGAFALAGGSQSSAAALGVFGIGFLVVGIVYLLVFFFFQFYGQAIVVDDLGVVDGFKRSAGAVRRHLVSTLGYSIIVLIATLILMIVAFIGLFAIAPVTMGSNGTGVALQTPSLGVVAVAGVVSFVVLTIVSAFFMTYSVAFYRQISPARENNDVSANTNANVA